MADVPSVAATPARSVHVTAGRTSGTKSAFPEHYVLGIGLLACLVVAFRNPLLSLDQFFYPKEFALTLFAAVAAGWSASRVRGLSLTRIDVLLGAFLIWSAIACVGAANSWWAYRALGLTASGLAVFWVSRSVRDEDFGQHLTGFIAFGVAMIAAVAVLQAYGLLLHVSAGNRAPGGTLGNRNAMAHLVTLGLPVLVLYGLTARERARMMAASIGLTAVAMALVLSRSRAAWVATMIVSAGTGVGVLLSWPVLRRARAGKRVATLATAALIGVVAALYLPNKLVWTSATPYRDSLRGTVNYESGSGRGRLLQDANTLKMIREKPLTGMGPGNWTVRYPEYAPPDDPTYSDTDLVPVRRFPNGDWLGFAAERGLPGLLFLLLAGYVMLRLSWHGIRHGGDAPSVGRALALQATLTALAVIGIFDPVLLTPAGAFLGFMILGALAPPEPRGWSFSFTPRRRRLWVALVLVVVIPFAAQSGRQLWAAFLYRSGPDTDRLARATRVNPGDYLAHLLLAQQWADVDRCDLAGPHIERARALYPAAPVPERLRAGCLHRRPVEERLLDSPDAPELLNTKVVFSPRCQRVMYSSNQGDRIAPFAIDFSSAATTVIPVDVPHDRDLFVRSLSPDCRVLALVADGGGDGIYNVYLYDFVKRRLTDLTPRKGLNEADPRFSPKRSVLAYLSEGRLLLYDADLESAISVTASPAEFTSVEWSADGEGVFLEDRETNIWEYEVPSASFKLVWRAPTKSYSPRMIQSYEHFLYFVSDHESEFTQVYELDLLTSGLRRVYPSSHPQYSPRRRSAGELVFRTNIDGNVVAMRLRDGRPAAISPSRGVVYDYSLDFPRPLFVYAGERQITSIYIASGPTAVMKDVLPHHFDVAQPPAQEFRSAEGMVHFLFVADSHPQGWVVWLHGGPHEQVSPRFNPYFDFLTRLGYAVVALNYPGSTGIGKGYELRGLSDSAQVARQLAGIDEALGQVAARYPDFGRYVLVGVSYGSALADLYARRHPEKVTKFVDFSGAATDATRFALGDAASALPPILLIQGRNDPAQQAPERRAVLAARDRSATTRRLVLEGEGHYIGGMRAIRLILGEMQQFLTGSAS